MRLDPRDVLIASATPVLIGILVFASAFVWTYMLPLHAFIQGRNLHHIRIDEPVYVRFDKPVDRHTVKAVVKPATNLQLSWSSNDRLAIRPLHEWQPTTNYQLSLAPVSNTVHSQRLTGWRGTFSTQPRVGLAGIRVDGHGARNGDSIKLHSAVQLLFSKPLQASTVRLKLNGQPAAAGDLTWSPDNNWVTIRPPRLAPFGRLTVEFMKAGADVDGDPVTDPSTLTFNVLGLEPSNSTSAITPQFDYKQATMVVIENSGPARPQSGFQQADMVYEYISEYSITRMTAIYFNRPPATQIGPVRSCRLINIFLPFAFNGVELCSGASIGTTHYLFTHPLVPAWQNTYVSDAFFRVGFKDAPHNLYTDGGRAYNRDHRWKMPTPTFSIDPPHADNNLGQASGPPTVGLHGVGYSYDGRSQQYLRNDSGAPFIDASTNRQLHVKNVVLLHVGFHITNYVEDENGGAHSAWYDMLGSGAADIYSDGKVIHATWHMGHPGQPWYDNHQPVYFTDSRGNFIELNTGLTWIHVLGNGQRS